MLADSALEHYRGGFYNPAMYIAPTVSATAFGVSVRRVLGRADPRNGALFGIAAATGLVGTGFHVYNVSKREGGWSWVNVFYGAPLAAPMGITLAGLLGFAGTRVRGRGGGRVTGALLALLSAIGLVGTAAEAGLLHFRGAFQDPFMYLPVTVPPAAAAATTVAVVRPTEARRRTAHALLRATAAVGLAGTGFHVYGVARNMGGWSNWTQNVQVGPPIPAPPAFTGLALAGLAGLALLSSPQANRAAEEGA